MIYLIFSILSLITFIVLIFVFLYLKKDENNLKQVSNNELNNTFGKKYTNSKLANGLFERYSNIFIARRDSNYELLKDIVSDELYNSILLEIKNNNDNRITSVVNITKKDFSKLVDFKLINDLEVAKVWVKYSSIEYTSKDVEVISGSKETPINNEYILTFVKSSSQKEELTCPSCGLQTNILLSSRCIKCGNEIVPKKMHWVYVGKEKI